MPTIELSLPQILLITGFVIVISPVVVPVMIVSSVVEHANSALIVVGNAVVGTAEGVGSVVGGVVGGIVDGVGSLLGL